jgi:5-carboxymethyl-2-hydroxymuconate isomerase
VARQHYRIADGHLDNAFINVVLRLAPGRPFDVRKAAGETLFQALCDYLEPTYSSSPLAISYEIQELDADLRWKKNNLRDYLAAREKET